VDRQRFERLGRGRLASGGDGVIHGPAARGILTAIAAGVLLASPTAARALGQDADAPRTAALSFEAVREVLRKRAPTDFRTEADVVRQLVALGGDALPALFALHAGEEGVLPDEEDASVWWGAADQLGALATRALAGLPTAQVVAHLEERLAVDPSKETRLGAARALGALRSCAAVAPLLHIVASFDDLSLSYHSVYAPLEEGLADALVGDPASWKALRASLVSLSDVAARVVVRAVVRVDRPQAIPLLTDLLGRDRELDLVVLPELAELESRFPWRSPARSHGSLADLARSSDAELRRIGALLASPARASEEVDLLIELLPDDDSRVRRAARASLERLTGVRLGDAPEAWSAWLERELDWRVREGAELFERLEAGEPGAVTAALRRLARHPLFRAEIAARLVDLLDDELDPIAAVVACGGLAQVQARTAVPELVLALEHSDPRVSAAAWAALKALTGVDLPQESQAWDAFAWG
jgi:HEAT repeat protein